MILQYNCFISKLCNIPGGELSPRCYGNASYAENAMLRFEKWRFCDLIWKKRKSIQVMKRRREIEGHKRKKKIERKRKEKERRGEMRQGLTCSDWQPRFSQFGSLLPLCFCEGSRNTSSAIHFISIPTPASHLHSVSFASSFLFSTCHYISWMITQWQFHWPFTGLDSTLPSSKAGKIASLCYKHADFSLFFPFSLPPAVQPQSHFSSWVSTSDLPPQSPDQIQIFAKWPLQDPARLSGSSGTLVRIICLTSPRQQMSPALNSYSD